MTPERWQAVKEVFQKAMELDSDQRPEYLDRACSNDASLRQQVEVLLAENEGVSSSFLESPAAGPGAASPASKSDGFDDLHLVGRTISHYRVLRKLGGGGMGVVYVAGDLRLGRHVAVKFIRERGGKSDTALGRLRREAQALSSLNHPNICTIYEIEEYEGQPFIVMELLEGESLKEQMRGKTQAIEEVLEIGTQVADALEAAHARGVVHRDIKPANIFITKRGQAKVLDFGLAKLTPGPALDIDAPNLPCLTDKDGTLTIQGAILGTLFYMSPEQAKGAALDARTDIFSLGVVLYEMATGEKPFVGNTGAETLDAILNQQPASPLARNPSLPFRFESILSRALEKNCGFRYQTAYELHADLQRLRREVESAARPDMPIPSDRHAELPVARPARRPGPAERHVAKKWKLAASAAVVAIAVAVGAFFYGHRATALTEKDSIVLADFDNRTGDPVFDDTLKQALAVDLEQSPFLNIVSDRKLAATLRLMGRSPDQPVMGEVARELCQRMGSKAMLAGSISVLGNNYVIGLNAINCDTGDALVKQQARASGKAEVLKSLDNSASALRTKLGESLASVQKFATPIEEATTPSLEALKAYSMGRRAFFREGDVAAIPYYQHAVELDPNFAMAYSALAVSYFTVGQTTQSSNDAKKAFELRERVSEREKYRISAAYYAYATGELDKAAQTYQLWKQSYPRDFLAPGNLGDIYMKLGQWEKALRETQDVGRMEPNSSTFQSNLAFILLALGRMEDARATVQEALARKLDSTDLRLSTYGTAFIRADHEAMQQQLAWAAGRPQQEDWLLSTQSDTEAYFGRLGKSREFSRRAADSAVHARAKETAALWQANAGLREAEFGNPGSARQDAEAALASGPGRIIRSATALALARAGDTAQAQKIADSLNKDFPEDTIVQRYWLPSIHAAIEVERKDALRAVDILQAAAPYELGQCEPFTVGMMYPVYLRGQAYLLARQGKEAAAEFQRILDHRGIVLNFPLGALAHVGLGRAYALQGDTAKARAAYQDLLTLWKDADPDIPILKQAKLEYAKLK